MNGLSGIRRSQNTGRLRMLCTQLPYDLPSVELQARKRAKKCGSVDRQVKKEARREAGSQRWRGTDSPAGSHVAGWQ